MTIYLLDRLYGKESCTSKFYNFYHHKAERGTVSQIIL